MEDVCDSQREAKYNTQHTKPLQHVRLRSVFVVTCAPTCAYKEKFRDLNSSANADMVPIIYCELICCESWYGDCQL